MKKIQIKKGYTLDFKVSETVKDVITDYISLSPSSIPFIKPKLAVKNGDRVKKGSVLFFDKRDTKVVFLSPVSGELDAIEYGERRSIREIGIKVTGNDSEVFEKADGKIDGMERSNIEELLLKGGMWSLFKKFPYRDYPKTGEKAPSIIVNLKSPENEGPDPLIYLKGEEDNFIFGLKVLGKFTENVKVSGVKNLPEKILNFVTHIPEGPYPSSDPGVLLYHTKKRIPENTSWYIYGQDLLKIAKLLKDGVYQEKRIITVAGSPLSVDNCHYRITEGTHLKDFIKIPEKMRIVQGGVFRGHLSSDTPFSLMNHYSFTLVKEEAQDDMFGFVTPGFKKRSVSRAFLSFSSEKETDSSLNGEERACINCGTCAKYCPVDMFPNVTYKAVYADDPEEAAYTGLLDCVECGLCSFVCPSKIELAGDIKKAKAEYYKEQV